MITFCILFLRRVLLCSPNVDSPLQLLLAVVLKVHQLAIPQYEPTHLPVPGTEAEVVTTIQWIIIWGSCEVGHITHTDTHRHTHTHTHTHTD